MIFYIVSPIVETDVFLGLGFLNQTFSVKEYKAFLVHIARIAALFTTAVLNGWHMPCTVMLLQGASKLLTIYRIIYFCLYKLSR